jgi:hypothetical protein
VARTPQCRIPLCVNMCLGCRIRQQSWDVHAHGKSNHTQANGMMLRPASSGTVSNCARPGQIQACWYVSNSVRFEKTQIMVRYGVHDMQ